MGFFSTILGFTGFGVGVSAGLVIGYYFFIYFQPSDVKDPVIRPLIEQDSRTLQRLLPEIPLWVKNPDYDRIDWLNKFIEYMWPYLDKAICKTAKDIAKPIIAEQIPKYKIESVEFETFTLGSLPPTFQGMKVYVTDEKELIMEPSLKWAGNPNVALAVKAFGLKASIQMVDLQIFAAPRITLKPLVPSFPCFAKIYVSLMEKPHVDFGLKFLGADLMSVPGLYRFVQELIKDQVASMYIGARHFAAAAIAAGVFNPAIDFASPLDGDGHGSHTAAIAAGNNGVPVRMHGYEFGKASGMAPRARIAVYKALYRFFGGFVSDVVAAIEQAVHDGVDIINLSVGQNTPPAATKTTFLNPFDAALLSAVKAGVFVAQAAGNGGPFPKTVVSYSPWITSVAAAIDDRRYKNHLTLGNGKILPGIILSPATHANQTFTMVAANDVLLDSSVMKYSPADCQRPEVLNKNLVEGNILLCGYSFNFVVGTSSIKKVTETAKSLGAIGFVLAVENISPGTKFDPVPVGIPGILITDVSKSMELIDYYNISTSRDWTGRVKSFKATGSIGNGLMPIFHKSAPQVALFSSRGPNIKDYSFQDADILKPDILAPGSLIWAAWSPNGTDEPNYIGEGFAMVSGTSMAAPHIAGIAALLKQKHPHWSPAAIKSALMTTTTILDRAERPIQAQQYSRSETMTLVTATPFDYGSGHVNPRAALNPGLIFDAGYEDYLGFLCTVPGIDAHEIKNYTNSPCNYTLGHPSNLNTPSITISHLVGTETVTRTVTNVAEEETYVITARMAPAVAIETNPPAMTLRSGDTRKFTVTLTVRSITGTYSFGEVFMKGSRGHKVRIPVVAMGYNR